MWRDRYDDLWLWPMPKWFVRVCNKTIGVHFLEIILVGEIVGLALAFMANLMDVTWLRIVGIAMFAPAPAFIVLMVFSAQYSMWKHRQRQRRKNRKRDRDRAID